MSLRVFEKQSPTRTMSPLETGDCHGCRVIALSNKWCCYHSDMNQSYLKRYRSDEFRKRSNKKSAPEGGLRRKTNPSHPLLTRLLREKPALRSLLICQQVPALEVIGDGRVPGAFALFFRHSFVCGAYLWVGQRRLCIGNCQLEAPAMGLLRLAPPDPGHIGAFGYDDLTTG
jgi:hypothetical protein